MEKSALVIDSLDVIGQSKYIGYNTRRIELDRNGNWCGHDPESPRFFLKPEEHKTRPKIITWAMETWQRFYLLPASYFKEIRLFRNSSRQQRSEAREALACISQVLLYYTELASLRVGIPQVNEGFRSLTIEFLAEKAGIGLKRAQRAIKLLARAGYLKMIERFDVKEEGGKDRFIGLAAVKCITPSFFKACGINMQALSAQRGQARKRLNKKRSAHIAQAQESQAARNVFDFIAPPGKAKTHVDIMKAMLNGEQKSTERMREKERRRRESLKPKYNPQE